jgi:hypothetical protein
MMDGISEKSEFHLFMYFDASNSNVENSMSLSYTIRTNDAH